MDGFPKALPSTVLTEIPLQYRGAGLPVGWETPGGGKSHYIVEGGTSRGMEYHRGVGNPTEGPYSAFVNRWSNTSSSELPNNPQQKFPSPPQKGKK